MSAMLTPIPAASNHRMLPRKSGQGQARLVVMLAVCFGLGLGAGAYWFQRETRPRPVAVMEQPARVGLSENTLGLLQGLNSPVEIRFYALLRKNQGNAELEAFAARVAGLLAEYDQAGGDNVSIKLFEDVGRPEVKAAVATDGLEPLRIRQGDLDYLGVAVVCNGRKVVIPRLTPEWEAALEFDLSRAITRAIGGASVGDLLVNPPVVDAGAAQDLLQVLPEVESLSVEEATAALRARGLEEFKAAVGEMQTELRAAQQRLAEAQQHSAEAEQAARKNLLQLQADQTARLGVISQRMQNQLSALQQVKRGNP